MPRYAESPAQCFKRGLLPISLLRPGDIGTEIDFWLREAAKGFEPADGDPDVLNKYKAYADLKDKVKEQIRTLRERVTHFNLPYLSLPADTGEDLALQVFINMNTMVSRFHCTTSSWPKWKALLKNPYMTLRRTLLRNASMPLAIAKYRTSFLLHQRCCKKNYQIPEE